MILSVLIPTIPERKEKLLKLLDNLYSQVTKLYKNHSSLGLVEILIDDSKSFLNGGPDIGDKRNALVQKASGLYLCFLDDDDEASPNYIEQLVRMAESGEHILTFRCLVKNDYYWSILNMSLDNGSNQEVNPNGLIQRTPWHVCPILSSIAKKETFSSLNHNEDWDWMQRVLTHVKTEEHTDMILTQYNHSETGSEADKIVSIKQPSMRTILLSLAIDGREKYTEKSINLEKSIAEHWRNRDVRLYKSYPDYCTPHDVIPYKFKFDLIRKAKEEGYKQVIWLDSSIRLASCHLLMLFNEAGIIAFDNLGHPLYKYISDKAVKNLGITENQLKKIPQTWGGAIGFDFSKDKACEIFEEIYLHSLSGSFETSGSTREGFVSHRHDQAVMSVIFWKHGIKLLPYGNIVSANHAKEPFEYGQDYSLIYGD